MAHREVRMSICRIGWLILDSHSIWGGEAVGKAQEALLEIDLIAFKFIFDIYYYKKIYFII